MITTRDRDDVVTSTLQRITALQPPANEICVCADGCVDRTAERIRSEFPDVKLIENAVPRGSVASRDALLHLVSGEWVLSLDDDSYPLDSSFFERANRLIDDHPEVSVFSFPELRENNEYGMNTPASLPRYAPSYANCAALMKRSDYLDQSGFPHFFEHMYEEPDYAVQCYGAGRAVWLEPSITIRHHRSPLNRSDLRRHHLNARNELWSIWLRCPAILVPFVSLSRMISQFRHALQHGIPWALKEPLWWLSAVKGVPKCLRNRTAVPLRNYVNWLLLSRRLCTAASDLRQRFHSSL